MGLEPQKDNKLLERIKNGTDGGFKNGQQKHNYNRDKLWALSRYGSSKRAAKEQQKNIRGTSEEHKQ